MTLQLQRCGVFAGLIVVAACGGEPAQTNAPDPNIGVPAGASAPPPPAEPTPTEIANTAGVGAADAGAAGSSDRPRVGAGASAAGAGAGAPAEPAPQDAALPMPAAGSGAAPMPDAGTPAACPAKSSYNAGDNRIMIQHQSRSRRVNVYVPSALGAATLPVPLVLDFHGNGSSGAQEESGSGWKQKADSEGFIVAYPDGVGNGWNVGNCCGEALSSKVDDVGFAREIVKTVSAAACIDARRVYATGISNGAGLAHRLACEAADIFAAIAAASADLVTDPCKPSRPISELSVRGLTDTLVAYAGGNTGSTGWYSPGAKGTLALWKDIDGCAGTPDSSKQHCETYNSCQGGVEITLCSLPNTGHILYNNSLGFSVPDVAWEMFKRQPMR